MWIAEVKLSRRRTWHSSCAKTASSWCGVRHFSIPSGKSRIGRKNPTTPGSRKPGEERTSTGATIAEEALDRTADRTRSQRRNRSSAITASLHLYTSRIATGVKVGPVGSDDAYDV